MSVSIAEQIACVKRELAYRKRVYLKWVASGRMERDEAEKELARMTAVLATLEGLKPPAPEQGALL